MNEILVIYAMECEKGLIERLFPDNSTPLTLCRCGIGKVNAAMATEAAIIGHKPSAVVNIGLAGSFAGGVSVGDIIVADEVAYHDVWCGLPDIPGQGESIPLRYRCDKALADEAALRLSARKGLIITGDQFYINEAEDRRQMEMYPSALAVDMESAAIAQVCTFHDIPFVSVRVISDVHDSHQAEHYSNFVSSLTNG